jgi:hypothetical protein
LAIYLERTQAAREDVLAHRLAAATVQWQISSGLLISTLQKLAGSYLPSSPPRFEEIANSVERIDGVYLLELFELLPKRAPDGDTALDNRSFRGPGRDYRG